MNTVRATFFIFILQAVLGLSKNSTVTPSILVLSEDGLQKLPMGEYKMAMGIREDQQEPFNTEKIFPERQMFPERKKLSKSVMLPERKISSERQILYNPQILPETQINLPETQKIFPERQISSNPQINLHKKQNTFEDLESFETIKIRTKAKKSKRENNELGSEELEFEIYPRTGDQTEDRWIEPTEKVVLSYDMLGMNEDPNLEKQSSDKIKENKQNSDVIKSETTNDRHRPHPRRMSANSAASDCIMMFWPLAHFILIL